MKTVSTIFFIITLLFLPFVSIAQGPDSVRIKYLEDQNKIVKFMIGSNKADFVSYKAQNAQDMAAFRLQYTNDLFVFRQQYNDTIAALRAQYDSLNTFVRSLPIIKYVVKSPTGFSYVSSDTLYNAQ